MNVSRFCILCAALGMLAAAAPPVLAQQDQQSQQSEEEKPFHVQTGVSELWDSNVFRVADGSNDLVTDRITTAYVGLSFDKVYSQQAVNLHLTQSAVRYANHSYLNNNPFEYGGIWGWHLTPRISGSVTADRTQALNSFETYRNPTEKNLRTSVNNGLNLDGWVTGGWHAIAGVAYSKTTNSQTFIQLPGYRANSANGGIKYVAASGSTVSLTYRGTNGDYLDQPLNFVAQTDTGYWRRDAELLANWLLSGKSSLTGRLTWVDYRTDHFPDRDFSGAAGGLIFDWTPTQQLHVNAAATRDLGVYQDFFASYTVTDTFSIAPTWQMSAKTSLQLSLSRSAIDYRGPIVPLSGPLRHDTVDRAQLGFTWTPLRSLALTASVARDHRDSNDPTQLFNDRRGLVSASLQF